MYITKKRKQANTKVKFGMAYTLQDASSLIKEVSTPKFDASIDLHIRLGVDPRKADQAIRGVANLPHGTGKTKRVLVLCNPDKEAEARESGADYFGLQEYVEKIEKGWTEVDVIIATPSVMPKIARLGKILGPRNLMPNPKSGTVTDNVADAVKEVKGGKIAFRVDKQGIIHASVGRVSFPKEKILENANELIHTVIKMKPSSAKGIYLKSITMASTMSPGISIDTKPLIS
ncbi:MAG: 50S ribosomal protein L1 [Chitinophagales bacterium]|nr:50S ribosomal protein L1 [Chitinophagales bacterium]